jgi:hypothetical protein
VIPKIIKLQGESAVLGLLLDRAAMLSGKACADAREIVGDAIWKLSTEELVAGAQDMIADNEADEIVVAMMRYANARIWRDQIAYHRREVSILNLNSTSAMVERYWNVDNPPYHQMRKVYEQCKTRYNSSLEG